MPFRIHNIQLYIPSFFFFSFLFSGFSFFGWKAKRSEIVEEERVFKKNCLVALPGKRVCITHEPFESTTDGCKSQFLFFYNILPRLPILFLYYIQFLNLKKKYGIHPCNPAELKVVHRRVEILKKKKNYTTCALHLVSGRLAANFLLSGFQ